MRNKRQRRVAATEAAKTFGALVDRVRESGEVYQVESRGQAVAEIGPPRRRFTVADFIEFLERTPRAPAEFLDAVEETLKETRRQKPSPVHTLSGRGGRRPR